MEAFVAAVIQIFDAVADTFRIAVCCFLFRSAHSAPFLMLKREKKSVIPSLGLLCIPDLDS